MTAKIPNIDAIKHCEKNAGPKRPRMYGMDTAV